MGTARRPRLSPLFSETPSPYTVLPSSTSPATLKLPSLYDKVEDDTSRGSRASSELCRETEIGAKDIPKVSLTAQPPRSKYPKKSDPLVEAEPPETEGEGNQQKLGVSSSSSPW